MVVEWSKYITLAIEYRKYSNNEERNKILNELIGRYDPVQYIITSTGNNSTGCAIVFDVESVKTIKENESRFEPKNEDLQIEEKDGITLTEVADIKEEKAKTMPDILPQVSDDTRYIDIILPESNPAEDTERDRMRKVFLQELQDDIEGRTKKKKKKNKMAGMWKKIWCKVFGHNDVITDPARILEDKIDETPSSISLSATPDNDYEDIAKLVKSSPEPLYKGPSEEELKFEKEKEFEPNIEELFGRCF